MWCAAIFTQKSAPRKRGGLAILRNILYILLHILSFAIYTVSMLNPKPVQKIWVFTHKAAFMQRISDYVRTGHQAYISGITATEKIFPTWEKLVHNNPVYTDRLKAFRAREKGEPTGRLLLYQNINDPDKIHWFLLVHGTKDKLPSGEKWQHAEDQHHRIYFTGYELVRITKEGLKKPSWTWKYSQERFQDLRDSMVMAIRSRRDQDLKNLIDKIFGTMGFSGSREQAKSLAKLMKEEWAKRRLNDPMPEVPNGIGWVRRKVDKGIFLNRTSQARPVKKERPVDVSKMLYADPETIKLFEEFNTSINDEEPNE